MPLPLSQIALSVSDVQHSQRWYRDAFGYLESGGTSMFVPILGSSDIQGVPGATSECWWLMDAQDFFQLELFQFRKPTPASLPADWRPCDIGYTTVGIHVADFDATLARLAHRQVPLLTEPIGPQGSRRACVRDPDGVLLEVMEDDPRSARQRSRPHDVPVATRFVTLSVPDLDQARRTWIDVLGLVEEPDIVLHGPEHESLWGLDGAHRRSLLLSAEDVFVEVVEYTDPVGRPWPEGYLISDHGLLNVALGLRSADEQGQLVQRCIGAGIMPNTTRPTLISRLWYAVYVNDPLGFSIELLYHSRPGRRAPVNPFDLVELGFYPRQAPVTRVRARELCDAPPERVWRTLVDHGRMPEWSPFSACEVVTRGPGGSEVGTVRRLSGGPAGLRLTETMGAAEEPSRLEYTARGIPGQWMYHGFVTLDPTPAGGTWITWEAQFRSPVPGARRLTSSMLHSLVRGLSSAAEQAHLAP